MSRLPIMGMCTCGSGPYPTTTHILDRNDPSNPREDWRVTTPDQVADVLAVDGFWNVFEASKAYRIELRSGFPASSSADWFVDRSRCVLQTDFSVGDGQFAVTPPVLTFGISDQSRLVDYPLTVKTTTVYPDTEFDPDDASLPAGSPLMGYTLQRILDYNVEFPDSGRAMFGGFGYHECIRRDELTHGTFAGRSYLMTPPLTAWLYNSNPCDDDYLARLLVTKEWLPPSDYDFSAVGLIQGVNANAIEYPPLNPPVDYAGLVDLGRSALLVSVSHDPNFNPG